MNIRDIMLILETDTRALQCALFLEFWFGKTSWYFFQKQNSFRLCIRTPPPPFREDTDKWPGKGASHTHWTRGQRSRSCNTAAAWSCPGLLDPWNSIFLWERAQFSENWREISVVLGRRNRHTVVNLITRYLAVIGTLLWKQSTTTAN